MTPRRILRAVAVAALLGVVVAPAAGAQEPASLDGREIVRIVVRRFNVFDTTDPSTSAWPYRAANALHIVSKESFIRSMLLFDEGDPYSGSDAEESARILRSLGFLNPVEITAREVEGGVEVTVETHDQWTLELDGSLGVAGSRSETELEIVEENFLGYGQEVRIAYRSDNERDQWGVGFADPNVLGSRWRLRLEHFDATDGARYRARVDYPFYSLATPRAGGVEWLDERRTEHLYSESTSRVTGRSEIEEWLVWGGIRLPGEGEIIRRVRLGWDVRTRRHEDWAFSDGSPYPQPADLDVSGPRIGFERVADRFVVLRGFRAWSVQEDVALGPNLEIGLTASAPGLGGDRERLLFDAELEVARLHREDLLLLATVWTSGRIEEDGLRNGRLGIELAAAELGRTGWQGRLLVEDTHDLDLDLQLPLGAEIGLRGWDPDFFDGTGRALLNLQWRTLVWEDLLNVMSVGALGFVDLGHTWGARVGPGTSRVRANIGVGLLLDLSVLSTTNLLRLEVALPDDGSGLTYTVTTSALF